jgi:thiol-disulfide isomerase/thioredoxin
LLLLLGLATLAATPTARQRPGAITDADALRAVQAVVTRYHALASYRIEGTSWNEVSGPQGQNRQSLSMRFAVQRPHHIASQMQNSQTTMRTTSNGDSVWTELEELQQYRAQSLTQARAELDSSALELQFHPASQYVRAFESATHARALGRDTVRTARGPVNCQRYEVRSAESGERAAGIFVHPRVLWVDPVSQLVLLDSVLVEQTLPDSSRIRSVAVTRLTAYETDLEFTADVFAFKPGAGMHLVRRFMQRSPRHADMEGQPAGDFTLETLTESKAVRLSDLKGKVVVLDFWATWCGPCRGWLPIVAKVRHDFADKGLVVYAVNEREPESKVREYLTKQPLDVPVLMDLSGSVGTQYRASSIPLTVVVGRDGNVVRVLLGLHQEEDLLEVLREAGLE